MPRLTSRERANKENFAIYMLKGWERFVKMPYIKSVLSDEAEQELLDALEYAVSDIKVTQNKRRRNS